MNVLKNAILMMMPWYLAGCAVQPNFDDAIRVVAYGEDGNSPGIDIEKLNDTDIKKRGVLYEFNPGDTIRMSIDIEGSLAETAEYSPIQIHLKRKFWLFVNNYGWWASLDGDEFRRFNEFSDSGSGGNNSLGVSFGINESSMSNDLKIKLVINPE